MNLLAQEETLSYEHYALATTQDMLRDLINVLTIEKPMTKQEEIAQNYNVNRVYSALAQLSRIDL